MKFREKVIEIEFKREMQDPVRKFTGREKYKRQLWATSALENPTTVRRILQFNQNVSIRISVLTNFLNVVRISTNLNAKVF